MWQGPDGGVAIMQRVAATVAAIIQLHRQASKQSYNRQLTQTTDKCSPTTKSVHELVAALCSTLSGWRHTTVTDVGVGFSCMHLSAVC